MAVGSCVYVCVCVCFVRVEEMLGIRMCEHESHGAGGPKSEVYGNMHAGDDEDILLHSPQDLPCFSLS